MRKFKKAFITGMATMVFAISNVYATDLTSQIKTGDAGLGGSIEFTKTYDDSKDLNKILVTLLVDQNSINTILNQASGTGSSQSIFYFSLNPKLEQISGAAKFKKNFAWIGSNLTYKTLEEALDALPSAIAGESAVTYSEVWPNAITIEYFDGTNWKTSSSSVSGKTIREDLEDNLGTTELVYGENFRFSMYDEYQQIWGWDILDASDQSLGVEYVEIDWEIKFPVMGKEANEQVMYISIEDALLSGNKEIIINENIEAEGDLEIPEGVELIIAKGVKLTIKDGKKLENKGTIKGTVVVDGENKNFNSILVGNSTNGTIKVDKNNTSAGEKVKIETTAEDGYKVDKITVTNKKTGEELTVNNNEFVMPEDDVEVNVTFVAVNDSVIVIPENNQTANPDNGTNPPTGDNIGISIGLLTASAAAIALATKKKHLN